MEKQILYTPENKKNNITLTEDQKNIIRNITLGIEEVDETIRSLAFEDVVNTLGNGNPLNRIINDQEGKITGYIACEDFVPKEAYIKYLGTTRQTGRNLLQEIPAFLEYAKQQGYSKINFHGWNDRLNHILERYGFERIRTDSMSNFNVDFYEKSLSDKKQDLNLEEERIKAFEQKYINKINQEYNQTLNTFIKDRQEKENVIKESFDVLEKRLSENETLSFKERQKAILRLKLARYFQGKEEIDLNTLFDAIIETPNFINTDKGSLFRLLEIHEQKTLQKIAEIRKERAEINGNEKFNPYEALFETKSGNYYMARLLNMPHLEEESSYMNHCVGTSDSYINKIKRGEVEILSFRNSPKINNNKLQGDTPVITIEYNLKTKTIKQMKKKDDHYLNKDDLYFNDVVDALKQLRKTKTDGGELRDFIKINESELNNFKVKDYHLLTENGEIDFLDFNPNENVFVLKVGNMEINNDTTKVDASKIIKIISNKEFNSDQIAYNTNEVNENTKIYIGEWNPEVMKQIPENINELYESFPEKKILRKSIELTTKTKEEYTENLLKKGYKIYSYAQDILNKLEPIKQKENIDLISFSVAQLGFPNGATLQQIYDKALEFDLELCPPQVGPELRLDYEDQPNNYLIIAMDPISDRDGYPTLFSVGRYDSGSWLDCNGGRLSDLWSSDYHFVFRSRKNL